MFAHGEIFHSTSCVLSTYPKGPNLDLQKMVYWIAHISKRLSCELMNFIWIQSWIQLLFGIPHYVPFIQNICSRRCSKIEKTTLKRYYIWLYHVYFNALCCIHSRTRTIHGHHYNMLHWEVCSCYSEQFLVFNICSTVESRFKKESQFKKDCC